MSAVADPKYAQAQLKEAKAARSRLVERAKRVFGEDAARVIDRVAAVAAARIGEDNPGLFSAKRPRSR